MISPRFGVLSCIGKTSLVPLQRIVPAGSARVLLKLESENPTGSMKDRMALAMIEAAEADGRLTGSGVVEYTTGNTGISLSLICAVKGYPLHIVTSDAYAPEKRNHMAILGATLHVMKSDGGRMTEQLTKGMIETARGIASETGAYWTNQLSNADQLAAFTEMADEIVEQTAGRRIDGFVQAVGSAACFRGIAERLRHHHRAVITVAVEPAESAVLSGGPSGAHKLDGMGAGFVVPLWNADAADEIDTVSTEEALSMAMQLARVEGLFGGATTGANMVAALRLAKRLGPDATVVTSLCDTGTKYLSVFGNRMPPET